MDVFRTENNCLKFHYDAEELWIQPWGANSFRIRATKLAEMPKENWALEMPVEDIVPKIQIEEKRASIINGKIKAVISSYGKLTIYNSKDEILLDEYLRNRLDVFADYCSALDIEAREFKPILGGDYHLSMRFVSNPEEKIYGMGQYQQPYLNLKGTDLELAQRNSQASVPFAVSSLGYGFLWNNPGVGRVMFGKNITTWEAYSTKVLDYWITAGDSPAEIEEAYASVTGTVPMMPDYAMGFWQCKLRYQTQDELLNVAREYKKRGLPISVIVIDYFHWPLQGDWKFDEKYWPDPDAMIQELKEMGIELMVSIWPTVDYRSENFQEMKEKGFAYVDQGALVVDVKEENDTKEIPPCMLLKSDGASLYTTTDLATIVERMKLFNPDEILYVVDKRQELHFIQVFRCARKTGLVKDDTKLSFLGFGTMNGKDGKPFKTREGGVMRLETLIKDINEEMFTKIVENRSVKDKDAKETAEIVGLSAIKYGDLSNQATKDYIFDIDRFTSFEGNTGPYILYTIVRIKSILNRFAEEGGNLEAGTILDPVNDSQKNLMLQLTGFGATVENAFEEKAPHKICAYIYEVSNAFNSFYHETKILSEENEAQKASFIQLLKLTKKVLETCIDLLGFSAPDRM